MTNSRSEARAGRCARCDFERKEHHHDGACYGLCGEYVAVAAFTEPAAAMPASDPVLPCSVFLPPALTISAGCNLSTLIHALELRGMKAPSHSGETGEARDAEVGNLADADEAAAAARAAGYRPENPRLWGAALNGAHVAIDRRRRAGLDPETVETCARALVDKLELIGTDPGGAFSMLAIRGTPYRGPHCGDELKALKAALSPGKTGSAGVGEQAVERLAHRLYDVLRPDIALPYHACETVAREALGAGAGESPT